MKSDQLQIKKKILEYLKIEDDLYLKNDCPLYFVVYKRISIRNNTTFEEEILRANDGYRTAVYLYDIMMMLEKEYNIYIADVEVPNNIDDLCDLVCQKIKDPKSKIKDLEEHDKIHASIIKLIEDDK